MPQYYLLAVRLTVAGVSVHNLHSTFFIGLRPKFLDCGSQPSLNGSPRNLHTSLVWDQTLKPTFERFLTPPEPGGCTVWNAHNTVFDSKRFAIFVTVELSYYGRPNAIGQAIIFSCCCFFFLFSSPILSRRRLDVYHTSTHGVALVQI